MQIRPRWTAEINTQSIIFILHESVPCSSISTGCPKMFYPSLFAICQLQTCKGQFFNCQAHHPATGTLLSPWPCKAIGIDQACQAKHVACVIRLRKRHMCNKEVRNWERARHFKVARNEKQIFIWLAFSVEFRCGWNGHVLIYRLGFLQEMEG
jgi:hypothetical protein